MGVVLVRSEFVCRRLECRGVRLDRHVAADEIVDAAIQDEDLSANDIIEVLIAVAAGTGTLGEGLFVSVELYEDAL